MRARANASKTLFWVLALGQAACGALSGVAEFDGGGPLGFGLATPQEDGGAFSSLDSGAEDALLPTREDGGDTAGDGGWLLTDGGFAENDGGGLFDGGMVPDAASGTEDAGTPGNVCSNGQHWSGSECAANVRVCDIPNGTGIQVWSNGSWGICVRTTCDPGYREDGIACVDDCPDDPQKSARGICGCGVPDTDSDGDGTLDCNDGCPADAAKTTPGTCGCGVPETDSDGDGTLDCNDGCPADAAKTAPGTCGCGVPETDSDGDGTLDCEDACPNDAVKWTTPGVCGCGIADTDSDEDGTPDCNDQCPDNAPKIEPGVCGCGIADTDSDGDGTLDCNESCPLDAAKTAPGTCGCGVPETDSDGDGTLDCEDSCPADSDKTSPGVCGCGIADTDSDGDGTLDCNDSCPLDAAKTTPGTCGCGVPETDSDGDGTPDCNDDCPNDAAKTTPATCGCGFSEEDMDNNGYVDCAPSTPVTAEQHGRRLTVTHVYLNDTQRGTVTVSPGAQVKIQVAGSVAALNTACPGCVTQFYARMNNVFTLCLGGVQVYDPRDGTSSIAGAVHGWSFDVSTTFNAPQTPGIYFINPKSSWDYKCLPSTAAPETRTPSTIATIVVQ